MSNFNRDTFKLTYKLISYRIYVCLFMAISAQRLVNVNNEKGFFLNTHESRASPLSFLKYDSFKLWDLDIWCVYYYIHIINPTWPPKTFFGLEIHWFTCIILSPIFLIDDLVGSSKLDRIKGIIFGCVIQHQIWNLT